MRPRQRAETSSSPSGSSLLATRSSPGFAGTRASISLPRHVEAPPRSRSSRQPIDSSGRCPRVPRTNGFAPRGPAARVSRSPSAACRYSKRSIRRSAPLTTCARAGSSMVRSGGRCSAQAEDPRAATRCSAPISWSTRNEQVPDGPGGRTVPLRLIDFAGRKGAGARALNNRGAQATACVPTSPGTPYFRITLYKLAERLVHIVSTVQHNIVWDGWSFDIFLREFSALYGAFAGESLRRWPRCQSRIRTSPNGSKTG